MENENPYVLYILMRTDLDSLNAGKAMAQSNHAYGALKKRIRSNLNVQKKYLEWMESTDQEFGTTLVLAATEMEIKYVLNLASTFFDKHTVSGWVHDPTYPVHDGNVVHLIPLNTCAFLFSTKEDANVLVGTLKLHP